MTGNESFLRQVRAYLGRHGGRRGRDPNRAALERTRVRSYVSAMESALSGVEAHAETMRQLRNDAFVALINLDVAGENGSDYQLQRYAVLAGSYVRGLELAMSGEGAGAQELEQLRVDYEAAESGFS
jgi:hypothetical protein